MFENQKLARELNKRVKDVEKAHGDYISFVLHANFEDNKHIMLVEGESDLSHIYDELSDLEKADLVDFWKKELDERPNKKRRNLLRWP